LIEVDIGLIAGCSFEEGSNDRTRIGPIDDAIAVGIATALRRRPLRTSGQANSRGDHEGVAQQH
jgi:hypothetical protein